MNRWTCPQNTEHVESTQANIIKQLHSRMRTIDTLNIFECTGWPRIVRLHTFAATTSSISYADTTAVQFFSPKYCSSSFKNYYPERIISDGSWLLIFTHDAAEQHRDSIFALNPHTTSHAVAAQVSSSYLRSKAEVSGSQQKCPLRISSCECVTVFRVPSETIIKVTAAI